MDKKINAIDVAQIVLSLCFLLGMVFLFHPCGPKEDGSWMHCHWAGVAVAACAAIELALAVLRMLARSSAVRRALSVMEILAAIAAAVIPGNVISLCMMDTMRCHAVMRPAAIVFAVLIGAVALLGLILPGKRGKI